MDQYNYRTDPDEFPFATAIAKVAQRVDLDQMLYERGTIDFRLLFSNVLRHHSDINNLFGQRMIEISERSQHEDDKAAGEGDD